MPFVLDDPTQTAGEIHVGDIGTVFVLTIYNQNSVLQDLSSGVTSLLIRFESPSKVVKEKVALPYTNGADGKIKYVLIEDDIDEHGVWKYQAIIEFTNGIWHTNVDKFKAYPNIES